MTKPYFFKPFDYNQKATTEKTDPKEPFGSLFSEDLSQIDNPKPTQCLTGPNITPTWSGGPDGGPDWDF